MATAITHIPIDKAGRMVLPKKVRDRMGISPGTEFEVIEEKDRIVLKPVPRQPRLIREGSVLVVVPDDVTAEVDVVELVKKDREARIQKFLK